MNKVELDFEEEILKAIKIRKLESELLNLYSKGLLSGTVHTCVGQELSSVFLSKYTISGDNIYSNHRGHGHYCSHTNDVEGLIDELMGAIDGCAGGYGGSQHLINNNFMSNGIQGGMIPIAAGRALFEKKAKTKKISIAYVGDGTIGQGIIYESLNISSLFNIPLLMVIEDNKIAQSTPTKNVIAGSIEHRVSAFEIKYYKTDLWNLENLDQVCKAAAKYVRYNSKPAVLHIECSRLNSHSKGDDNRAAEEIRSLKDKDIINIYENNNIKSLKIQLIEDEIKQISKKAISKQKLINSVIQKLVYEKEVGFKTREMQNKHIKFIDKLNSSLSSLLENYEHAIIFGEDIEDKPIGTASNYGGAFKVTKGLSTKYPDRVINSPISEGAIIGLCTGYALGGNPAVAEIMFGDFMTLCVDQIIQHASKFKSMYGKDLDIPLIIRTPMGGGRGYGPTHSQSIERLFLGWPGLEVVSPNVFTDVDKIFKSSLNSKNRSPMLLIENKIMYGSEESYSSLIISHQLSDEKYPTHKILIGDERPTVSIFTYGQSTDIAVSVASKLFMENEISSEIISPEIISPLNITPFLNSAKNKKAWVFIEEGASFGSFSSELHSHLCRIIEKPKIVKFYSNNSIIPASIEAEKNLLPNADRISAELKAELK
jgi:2-oxoisovalerate dehydrogenase E1 component